MNNQEIIAKVKTWQEAGFVHELTCLDSDHGALVPEEKEGKVILVCKYEGCGYTQQQIPEFVLNWDKEAHLNRLPERFRNMIKS